MPVLLRGSLALLCGILFPLSSSALDQGKKEPSSVLVQNVRVFDGRGEQLREAHVLVEGNRIVRLSRNPIQTSPGMTVIDGGGRVMIPGLIDTHVHLTATVGLALPATDAWYLAIRQTVEAERTLMRGFTTVRDMGGNVFALKRAVDEGLSPGPRIYPSGAVLSQTSGHADFRTPIESHPRFGGHLPYISQEGNAMIVDGVSEVLAATREQLRRGASQIKVMAGGGVISPSDPIDVKQYTSQEMEAAVQAAADWNTYVAVHAYNSESITRALQAGVKSIEHGNLIDEAAMKLLVDKGAVLSPQVAIFQRDMRLPTENMAKLHQVRAGLDTMFALAKRYGAKITFGTDIIGPLEEHQRQGEEFGARLKWFTPVEILRQATSNAADLLALSGPRNPYPGKLGVIEEGAYADLLVVNGNPLEDVRLLEKPADNLMVIMKNGQVYKNSLH